MISLYCSIAGWLCVVACSAPAAWRILTGNGQEHDATKWGFFLVALLMLAFNGRWLVAKDNLDVLVVLRVFSVVLAFYLCAIIRFYKL